MSYHSFNPFMAKKYGIIEAILIESIVFWTKTNAAKEKNFHEGRYWCFGTSEYLSKFFIFLSPAQIKYALAKLVKSGALLKNNFNKNAYDQTNWYALSDDILNELMLDKTCLQPAERLIEQNCSMGRLNLLDGSKEIVRPIQAIKKAIKKTIKQKPSVDSANTTVDEKLDLKNYKADTLFMQFYKAYPLKQKPLIAYKAFRKLKPNQEFVDMLVADIGQRVSANWLHRDKSKLPFPATYLNAREWEGEIFTPQPFKLKTTQTERREFIQ